MWIYWVHTYMCTLIAKLWKTSILRKFSHVNNYVGKNSYPSITRQSPIFLVRIILLWMLLSRVALNAFPDEMPALVDCSMSINNVTNSTNGWLSEC